jgi:NADH-quinone oxidoreductase subunit D
MEQKSWWKAITYAPRIDYLAYQSNELVFVLAIEKLLGLEPPPKATWMRMLLSELNRIQSHLVWLGTAALELGAISMFWYTFREREQVLDLTELVAGYRMHTRYFQTGGLAEDIPPGFYPECRKFVEWMPKAIDDYDALLARNEIWLERTRGLGLLNRGDAIALGQTGPVLRASGVDWDLRRDDPYLYYDRVHFHVPVFQNGDTYDRYRVRVEEMRHSVELIEQCLDRLERLDGEPWIADDRKVVLPPREELHTSMESLIHHFKIVTEGYRVPEGEVYVAVESPRGELGCYLVSDGGAKPWRVKFRAPSFAALEATATAVQQSYVADLIAIVGSLDTVMGEVDR